MLAIRLPEMIEERLNALASETGRTVEAGGAAPIPLKELIEVARVTIEAAGR